MFLLTMNFFQEEIIECEVDDTGGGARGLIRWHFGLEWAPGGEEFLLDNPAGNPTQPAVSGGAKAVALDISRPWWTGSRETETDAAPAVGKHSQAEEEEEAEVETMVTEKAAKHPPRDIRLHYYSHIPLDLLAHFEPSEFFPRGWFCRQCGMINTQTLFRHQICRSSTCKVRYLSSAACSGRVC